MIFRKLVTSILTCGLVMLIFFFIERTAFIIFIGMYLLPILLLYGVPVSILSDFTTKRLKGVIRAILALFIHLFFATMFYLIPIYLGWEESISFSDLKTFLVNFIFMLCILASSLFWCIDEIFRSTRVKDRCSLILNKIGDLRI
ncbi:hypothetical protein [Sutcliffiella halmapala]|uniref:hypothetical protein n=1 Tax=Sutcliffiella halmapala TaxID=79882 RepID=UPI0009952C69|nr:hypothetical protein [Sutcliffiella halmapala]